MSRFSDPAGLPRQRRGTTPQMRGRYPDYDVLEQSDHWDAETREVVLARAERVPPIRFFDASEERALRAFCDTVTAQDADPRVPVLELVDAKLYERRLDGFRYASMPDDRETWRLLARGLDHEAHRRGWPDFAAAGETIRHGICDGLADGHLDGGVWERLPPSLTWKVVMRAVLEALYSHPWAWNEIGFGGPAYPRGYSRLGADAAESWEGDEAFRVDPVEDVARRGVDE